MSTVEKFPKYQKADGECMHVGIKIGTTKRDDENEGNKRTGGGEQRR